MPLKIKIPLWTRFGRRLVRPRSPSRTTEPKTTTEIDITRQEYYYIKTRLKFGVFREHGSGINTRVDYITKVIEYESVRGKFKCVRRTIAKPLRR